MVMKVNTLCPQLQNNRQGIQAFIYIFSCRITPWGSSLFEISCLQGRKQKQEKGDRMSAVISESMLWRALWFCLMHPFSKYYMCLTCTWHILNRVTCLNLLNMLEFAVAALLSIWKKIPFSCLLSRFIWSSETQLDDIPFLPCNSAFLSPWFSAYCCRTFFNLDVALLLFFHLLTFHLQTSLPCWIDRGDCVLCIILSSQSWEEENY